MKTYRMCFWVLLLTGHFAGVFGAAVLAHPGGLDANGGHNDRKNGGYHYHRTPPAGVGAATASPKQDAAPAVDAKAKESAGFWITSSSGVRHNEKCRYFRTSKGRPCTRDEGRACKICGG